MDQRPPGRRITVSMAYYRCPALVARAVESVLAQTHRDLTLVVVNDGDPEPPWPLLARFDDARLVRFDLDDNRGRYFADAVVLEATNAGWFFVHDADDWSEPELLETYLAKAVEQDADVVFGAHVVHEPGDAPPRVQGFGPVMGPAADEPRDVAPHQALFRTDLLRAIGGYYAGLRIGYDTLVVNLARLTARLAYVEDALYHRVARAGSLTSAPDTGFCSEARRRAGAQIAEIYREVLTCPPGDVRDVQALRARAAAVVASQVTADDRSHLDSAIALLSTWLRGR